MRMRETDMRRGGVDCEDCVWSEMCSERRETNGDNFFSSATPNWECTERPIWRYGETTTNLNLEVPVGAP